MQLAYYYSEMAELNFQEVCDLLDALQEFLLRINELASTDTDRALIRADALLRIVLDVDCWSGNGISRKMRGFCFHGTGAWTN